MNEEPEIIVPFEQIGEPGWEGPTDAILQDIADNWGDERVSPSAEAELAATERRLGAALPPALRLLYANFGPADVGEQLQALKDMEPLQHWVEGFPWDSISPEEAAALPHLVTFSEYLGNGNAFCFHTQDHSVWYFDHDTDPTLTRFFDDAGDYFKGCLIKAQQDLLEEPEAEDLVEEMLVELFGEKIVAKWLY